MDGKRDSTVLFELLHRFVHITSGIKFIAEYTVTKVPLLDDQ